MNTTGKIATVLVLISVVSITLALRQSRLSRSQEQTAASVSEAEVSELQAEVPIDQSGDNKQASTALPRLVDLGAGKCIPCKMMAPILEELKAEYSGRFKVDFIDVWENPDVGAEYGIHMIPTQIFYDASGKELFRHEGFFSKTDILTKWKELGIEIESKQE
jgi:thioredoxin 1